jgi:transcriptional regulator with XRE-family HTH domain
MGISDLKDLCSQWDRSSEAFSKIVATTVKTLGLYQRELAAEFQVAESTVSRWSSGTARPHAQFQVMVVTAIKRRATNALKSSAEAPVPRSRATGRSASARHAMALKSHA